MSNRGMLRRLVHARLRARLRPREELAPLGYRLSEWVSHRPTSAGPGGGAEPAASTAVEIRVAQYLDQAVQIGRKWGQVLGALLSAGLTVVVVLITWIWVEVFS